MIQFKFYHPDVLDWLAVKNTIEREWDIQKKIREYRRAIARNQQKYNDKRKKTA
jgi:hypothetical protein